MAFVLSTSTRSHVEAWSGGGPVYHTLGVSAPRERARSAYRIRHRRLVFSVVEDSNVNPNPVVSTWSVVIPIIQNVPAVGGISTPPLLLQQKTDARWLGQQF